MKELTQEAIDAVFGECVFDQQKYVLWCTAHNDSVRDLAVRCDTWREFEDSVMRVIELLKEGQR